MCYQPDGLSSHLKTTHKIEDTWAVISLMRQLNERDGQTKKTSEQLMNAIDRMDVMNKKLDDMIAKKEANKAKV